MPDERAPADARTGLRAQVRGKLPALCGPLRILAEAILGADAPIDFLALTPEGRLVGVLLGDAGRELELVALALAQRAWLELRLQDLAQLVPGLRADLAIRVVLLVLELGPTARLALEALDGPELVLARILRPAGASGIELVLEPLRKPLEGRRTEPQSFPEKPRSSFRSRLTDAELGLEDEEPA